VVGRQACCQDGFRTLNACGRAHADAEAHEWTGRERLWVSRAKQNLLFCWATRHELGVNNGIEGGDRVNRAVSDSSRARGAGGNFNFSIFKRGMKGVYQHCGEKHLHRYLAEFDFRYNNRVALGVDDQARATKALQGDVGKRLTYRAAD
jgi:ISXO2-like transposase domain